MMTTDKNQLTLDPENTLSLLIILALGEQEIAQGKYLDSEQVFAEIDCFST